MTNDRQKKVKIVKKLAGNNVTGGKHVEIDTIPNWGFASHNEGKIKRLTEELVTEPEAPVRKYGGRDNVRLTSIQDAKDYINDNGGDIPWGL